MKKIILILVSLMLIATPAKAEDDFDNIDWINFDWDALYYSVDMAVKDIKIQEFFSKNKITPVVNSFYGPNFDKSVAQTINNNYTLASEFFGVKQTNVIYFNEKDSKWYQDTMSNLEGSYDSVWLQNYCYLKSWATCGMASQRANFPHYYHMIGSEHKKSNSTMDWIAHHETVHGWQKEYGLMNNGSLHQSCWILEAQANVLGFVSAANINGIENIRKSEIKKIFSIMPSIKNMSPEEFVLEFSRIENDRNLCMQKGLGYSIGMLVIEHLYMNYNIDDINNMFKFSANGNSFDSALQKYLKINQNQLYLNSFKHITRTLNYSY